MTVSLTGLEGGHVIDEGNVEKAWTVNANSLTWDDSLKAFDFGKNKGSYISVFLFNNGIIKKEYIINYGLVEENERLIFEFRNITVNTVHDAKNILINPIKDLKLA